MFLDNGLYGVEGPQPGDVWGFESTVITNDQANNFLPSWSEPMGGDATRGGSFAPWGTVGHGQLIFAGEAVAGIPGDIDGDGSVAFADFLILSNNFGTMVDPSTGGDLDGDGSVAFADFLILSDNFGSTAAAASVPEPSALFLMLFGLLPVVRRRKR